MFSPSCSTWLCSSSRPPVLVHAHSSVEVWGIERPSCWRRCRLAQCSYAKVCRMFFWLCDSCYSWGTSCQTFYEQETLLKHRVWHFILTGTSCLWPFNKNSRLYETFMLFSVTLRPAGARARYVPVVSDTLADFRPSQRELLEIRLVTRWYPLACSSTGHVCSTSYHGNVEWH